MTQLLSLAWRNIWRNRRRSVTSILSIAFGIASIALFAGYFKSTYTTIANIAVHSEMLGHLVINKQGFSTDGKLDPSAFLFSKQDIETIKNTITPLYPKSLVAPRISGMGILSNNNASTIFIGQGISPHDLDILRGPFRKVNELHPSDITQVELSEGLAKLLALHANETGTALASTIYGQVNALDANIYRTFNTGTAATNDKILVANIDFLRSLLDAPDQADTITVLLPTKKNVPINPNNPLNSSDRITYLNTIPSPNEAHMQIIKRQVMQALNKKGIRTDIQTWQEASAFYRQVKAFFDVIFGLNLVIVVAIVSLSITNTMSMTVIERTREIGTLRAIGMRQQKVIQLFLSEAFFLVLVGTVLGSLLLVMTVFLINHVLDIRFVPPTYTMKVPLYVGYDIPRSCIAALVIWVLSLLSAYFPVRSSAKQPIVNSLTHV